MKNYDLTYTNEAGEVYAAERLFKANWEFRGWSIFKNNNWLNHIPNVEFSLNGVNVVIVILSLLLASCGSERMMKRDCQGTKHYRQSNGIYL